MSNEYRIYVASLSDYNAGSLHGAWIDCDGKDADELQDEVNGILRASKYPNVTVECPDTGEQVPSAEEYAIHDREGFGDLVGEYTPLTSVAAIVEALESVDEPEALKEYAEHVGGDVIEIAADFEDAYSGQWDSEEDYARDLLDNTGELDDDSIASRYFDYAAYTRDLFMGDLFRTESGYVFWNH